MTHTGYEKGTDDQGHTVYLVGDEWVSRDEAAEYAQAEAGALAATGDPAAYDGYPAEIAPTAPAGAGMRLQPTDYALADEIRAADAEAVTCAVHPGAEIRERGEVDPRGVSMAVMYCTACGAGDSDDKWLARYQIPVLH
jgi:hypothetical protein